MYSVRIVPEYGSKLNKYQYLSENLLRKWHGYQYRSFIMLLAGLEEERGERKKLKKGALHLNDGLVHRSMEDLSVQSGERLHQAGQQ